MAKPTRTINSLHFEDLEPRRFEDLCRQLIYDLRDWSLIEAIGRLGADEGIDVRATERVRSEFEEDTEEDMTGEKSQSLTPRVWVVQCKRERSITPKEIALIVEGFFAQNKDVIYGYILMGACDFSKKARDAFRSEMVKHHIQESYLWGKAELEDKLYQPKNDYLLFAYFGISLQVSRRSHKSNALSLLATIRKLVKVFGDLRRRNYHDVLIRDPANLTYPSIDNPVAFLKHPLWGYYHLESHDPIDHLAFVQKKCLAYADFEKQEWDALLDYNHNHSIGFLNMFGIPPEISDSFTQRQKYETFWNDQTEDVNKAWYLQIRIIPYSRILAVDEIGDVFNRPPHLLVESLPNGDIFEPGSFFYMEKKHVRDCCFSLDGWRRIKFFPDSIPDPESTEK